jgi:CheY-like chemotaxis protein
VLVVDDEPAIGRVLERVLRPHEVVLVESGREALRQLALDPGFDLVLCDLMMPDVTGMALFEQACALLPGLEARFVFMTGGAFTPQAREFLATVPNPRLTKPFDLERVRVLLRELLARRAD